MSRFLAIMRAHRLGVGIQIASFGGVVTTLPLLYFSKMPFVIGAPELLKGPFFAQMGARILTNMVI
jgi:hypothetical protein